MLLIKSRLADIYDLNWNFIGAKYRILFKEIAKKTAFINYLAFLSFFKVFIYITTLQN
jgi:hypothetical protein